MKEKSSIRLEIPASLGAFCLKGLKFYHFLNSGVFQVERRVGIESEILSENEWKYFSHSTDGDEELSLSGKLFITVKYLGWKGKGMARLS